MSAWGRVAIALATGAAILSIGLATGTAAPQHRGKQPKFTIYKVEYKGSGSYGVQSTSTDGGGEDSAQFHWDVVYEPLLVAGKGPVGTGARAGSSTGGGTWSISSHDSESSCIQTGALTLGPFGGIQGTRGSKGVSLILIPGTSDFVTTNPTTPSPSCDTSDFWHDWVESFSHVGLDEGVDPLTSFVHLSNHDIKKQGKVVVNTSNSTLAAPSLTIEPDCGSGGGSSCHQTFSWEGTVTLKKKVKKNHG
jgi:hypothetical protein